MGQPPQKETLFGNKSGEGYDWESEEQVRLAAASAGSAQRDEPSLIVDVEGFEGPLDFLLMLARQQKLDLSKISILALAEQYLQFIEEARRLRLELAADYLVMAAWLAYLKSRLLLPDPQEDEEPTGEELAAMLAFRLKKLDAMRDASKKLMERAQLNKDFYTRGAPEDMSLSKKVHFSATLYDLLTSYAAQRQRQAVSLVHVRKREVWSLQEARDILQRLIGSASDWMPVDELLSKYLRLDEVRSTALASSFAASLELVREGHLELRQSEAFGRLMVRSGRGAKSGQGDGS
ncbi:MAG: segregation/condensation protein A [Cohaesibacter sp.]|jgi:segregation and condensation protein A|nr:segregation/condensation protein A [Cohaesibacter sp.]